MVGIDAALRHRMIKQGFELQQKGQAIRPWISQLHSTGLPARTSLCLSLQHALQTVCCVLSFSLPFHTNPRPRSHPLFFSISLFPCSLLSCFLSLLLFLSQWAATFFAHAQSTDIQRRAEKSAYPCTAPRK